MNKNKVTAIILIAVGFLIGFIINIVLLAKDFAPLRIDITIRDFFYNIRGQKYGVIYWTFRILTECGFLYVIVGIWLIFSVLVKFDRRSLMLGGGSLVVWLINTILKLCFLRTRPDESLRWMLETSSSFPSGHSMSAAFLYVMLTYYILNSNRSKKIKISLSILFLVTLVIVLVSRMVLGVHYFTDVLAGFSYGVMCSGIAIIIDEKLKKANFMFLKNVFFKESK